MGLAAHSQRPRGLARSNALGKLFVHHQEPRVVRMGVQQLLKLSDLAEHEQHPSEILEGNMAVPGFEPSQGFSRDTRALGK